MHAGRAVFACAALFAGFSAPAAADLWADYRLREVTRIELSEMRPEMRSNGEYLQAGPVRTIARHPRNAEEITVATTAGGLFRSNDGGATWRHLDGLPTNATKSVVYNFGRPEILLATSDEDWRSTPTGGVWRSVDGGETWSQPESARLRADLGCSGALSAYGLSVDPGRADRVYAATNCGVLVSENYGETWRRLPVGTDPRFAAVMAIGSGSVLAGGEAGVFYTRDGGTEWTRAETIPSKIGDAEMHAFAVSPFNTGHVFVATQDQNIYQSLDTGTRWSLVAAAGGGGGCGGTSFVKAVRTPASAIPASTTGRNWIRLYAGNKCGLVYKDGYNRPRTFPSTRTVYDWSSRWVEDLPCHDDTHDLAFTNSEPFMLATDGGIERKNGRALGGCRYAGSTWRLVGGARGGLNALQATDVAGQQLTDATGAARRYDLYFGTQHTSLWGSQTLGAVWDARADWEGGSFQLVPRIVKDDARMVFFTCAGCGINLSKPQFVDRAGWTSPNAPSDAAGVWGYPFLVARPAAPASEHAFVQHGYNRTPANQGFYLTQTFGTPWRRFVGLAAGDQIVGIPFAFGGADPGFYNPVRAPGPDRFALIQIRSVYGSATVVRPRMMRHATCEPGASSSDVVRIAAFGADFYWYPIYALDPFDPNHLLAGDASDDGAMVESRDGGDCWRPLPALTRLANGGGAFKFWRGGDDAWRMGLASLMSYSDKAPGHVLVGGMQNGLFFSSNGGANWYAVPGSEKITAAKWVHWQSADTAIIASYGRGLWKATIRTELRLERVYDFCRFARCELFSLADGAVRPFDAAASFDGAIMAVSGRIENATIVKGRLAGVSTTGGSDRLVYTKDKGAFAKVALTDLGGKKQQRWPALDAASKVGVPIGVLTKGGAPAFVVVADKEVTRPPIEPKALAPIKGRPNAWFEGRPMLVLSGANSFFGTPVITETDKPLTVRGAGFAPGDKIEIWQDGRPSGQAIAGQDGAFESKIAPVRLRGRHTVEARRSPGAQTKAVDSASYVVKPHDD